MKLLECDQPGDVTQPISLTKESPTTPDPAYCRSEEPFHSLWLDDVDRWTSQVASSQIYWSADTEIDWFLQNQSSTLDPSLLGTSPDLPCGVPLIRTFPQERDPDGQYPPPRYLQEAPTKVFVAHTGSIDPPNCGFPICNALTQERRVELLIDLRSIMEIDIRDPIFSLNSMKQGIHLWSREISTEYNFLHRELLLLQGPDAIGNAVLEIMGEPPGAQLIWSTISFGWALMRSRDDHEFLTASKIQRALRASILSVSTGNHQATLTDTVHQAPKSNGPTALMACPDTLRCAFVCQISGFFT